MPQISTQCHLEPVFVLSIGRSGSTLVQRVLNCHSEVTVWGEHGGYLRGIADAYFAVADNQHNTSLINRGYRERELVLGPLRSPTLSIPWVQPCSASDLLEHYRSFVLGLFANVPGTIRWGFKEIKYGRRVMRFLRDLFPRARFVINSRHPTGYISSRIRAWGPEFDLQKSDELTQCTKIVDEFIHGWAERHEEFQAFRNDYPYACFCSKYSDISRDRTAHAFDELFEFIGEEPADRRLVERVVGAKPDSSDVHCKDAWRSEEARKSLEKLIAARVEAVGREDLIRQFA